MSDDTLNILRTLLTQKRADAEILARNNRDIESVRCHNEAHALDIALQAYRKAENLRDFVDRANRIEGEIRALAIDWGNYHPSAVLSPRAMATQLDNIVAPDPKQRVLALYERMQAIMADHRDTPNAGLLMLAAVKDFHRQYEDKTRT